VSFAAVTLCVASQRVFIVVISFVIDSVREFLDTHSYNVNLPLCSITHHAMKTFGGLAPRILNLGSRGT
jgi:hypothetical protein